MEGAIVFFDSYFCNIWISSKLRPFSIALYDDIPFSTYIKNFLAICQLESFYRRRRGSLSKSKPNPSDESYKTNGPYGDPTFHVSPAFQ